MRAGEIQLRSCPHLKAILPFASPAPTSDPGSSTCAPSIVPSSDFTFSGQSVQISFSATVTRTSSLTDGIRGAAVFKAGAAAAGGGANGERESRESLLVCSPARRRTSVSSRRPMRALVKVPASSVPRLDEASVRLLAAEHRPWAPASSTPTATPIQGRRMDLRRRLRRNQALPVSFLPTRKGQSRRGSPCRRKHRSRLPPGRSGAGPRAV